MWQIYVVIVVLAGCAGYAGWRIYRALTLRDDSCKGCALAEKCTKKKGCPVCDGECHERK
ncbi:MAG: FeoB-associated Cys-rich membrane protein [Prevotella sp.]|nr:FeoB-associated Cys-rich membrane protein [Prevotella sp.]